MTIETTANRISYTGSGTTGPFSFPYYFLADGDLTVIKTTIADGTEETLTLTTDYTVSGAGEAAGGSVTLVATLSSAYKLTIIRDPDILQPADYPANDRFPAATHEEALDRATMIMQRLKDLIDRSFRLSDGDVSGISLILQNLGAGKLIAVNSAGTGIESIAAADVDLATVSAFIQTLFDDADAATARTTLGAAATGANIFTGLQTFAAGADIASASTLDLTAATGNIVRITGTTATSSVTLNDGQMVVCVAVGAWPLTHHSTNHPLPGSTNYTCSPGDRVIYTKDSSGAIGVQIVKKDGTAVVNSGYSHGLFYKADPSTVAFTKTGAGTAQIKAGTKIDVAGTLVEFASATSITMPTLTAGTDYAIWVKDDATIQADASFTSAPGAGNWRKIGGFHYAPGGNAAAVAGGDTTPAINAYSFWDLKFKPACPDPRGMTLVADSFWADIYLLGVDHLTNGTSKYNVTIADGSSPPKIPTKFGGNGSTAYSTLNWWEAAEVMQSCGKRLPTYDEFAALAYGTTEAQSSGGTDVPTTGVNGTGYANTWNEFTSKWGVIQATGCMWIWGGEFGGGAAAASWTANTGGRGSTYQMENAVVFGGAWGSGSYCGSRCSDWSASPTGSYNHVGARGVCDHLILE